MTYTIIMFPGPIKVNVAKHYFHVISKFDRPVVTKDGQKYKVVEGTKRQFSIEHESANYIVCDVEKYNP